MPAGSEAISGEALMAATEVLYNLSGQQFGLCELTVRPCRRDCDGGPFNWGSWWEWGGVWPRPLLYQGAWYNLTCGGCAGTCSCVALSEAWLPGPVNTVTMVMLNGSPMPSGSYRVDDFRKLVRTDGGMWPICQDLTQPDTAADTWSVTFTYGQDVPAVGKLAVAELACEIVSGCLGGACAFGRNATSVSRQGITIDFPTFTELLTAGMLGLRWTDMFVATYNPQRLKAPPLVFDVDGPSFRRVGT
jgi:hypothetical protein